MATVIRLKRGGRTHRPYYRVVVIDGRRRRSGREVEILGHYHPCARPEPVTRIDVAKAVEWVRRGAQPTDTARSVLKKIGVYKHIEAGTTPEGEETVAELKHGVVENKGYNPPPPPKEEPKEEPAAEAPAETTAAEGETEQVAADGEATPAPAADAEASAEPAPAAEATAEEAPAEEAKTE